MLVPVVLLGILPSLTYSFISASVGFLTEMTHTPGTFYQVLLCLYFMGALLCFLQIQFDSYFDSKYGAREVFGVRIFAPACTMSLVLASLGEVLAYADSIEVLPPAVKISILTLVAAGGSCAGALSGVGVTIAESVSQKHLLLVWTGIASAGMLCIAAVYAVGFTPGASAETVRHFFLVASMLVLACTLSLSWFHFRGDLDEAYERATSDEGLPMSPARSKEESWTPGVQAVNVFMTAFCFPLLPLLCSTTLAQELVLWKLCMDFLAPLVLLFVSSIVSFSSLGILTFVRAIGLAVTLWLLIFFAGSCKGSWQCINTVGSWDIIMLLGALISCLADSRPIERSAFRRQLLRKNRLAQHVAISAGLIASGALAFILHGPEEAISKVELIVEASPTCPACAEADAQLGSVKSFPCGGPIMPPGHQVSDEHVPWLSLFHYGANMNCKKFDAIDVQPLSAQAAYIPGQCLVFGRADGVPTTSAEPGYGNLEQCNAGGCVHGVVHKIWKSQLHRIHATEPGYFLVDMPDVIGYDGQHITGVKAYVMIHNMTTASPSRRYGGLLYCAAQKELAPAYAEQLACELAELGINDIDCKNENFQPVAVES